MRKFIFATTLLALSLTPACSHTPKRTPAAFKVTAVAPAANEFSKWANTLVGDSAKSFAKNRPAIEQEVASLLKSSTPAQRLLADHDLKLEKKDEKAAELVECQIWETQAASHEVEAKVLALQHALFNANDKDAYTWFVSLVWPAKSDSPALNLAKATYVRRMHSFHESLCSTSKACAVTFPSTWAGQPFNPLDEKALLEFKKTNLEKLANDKTVVLPKAASCSADAQRAIAAVTPEMDKEYDWKKYHFTGAGPELNEGEFVITYDDGPHGDYTAQLAQMWADSGLPKPTFFWLARQLGPQNPANVELAKQIRDAGFEIGCHSRSHANLDLLSRAVSVDKIGKNNMGQYSAELKANPPKDFVAWRLAKLDDQLYKATTEIYTQLELDEPGKPLDRVFRLPGGVGVGQPEVGKALAKAKARHYHWSIDSLDFNDPSPQSIVARVEKLMAIKKKGIILFHDIHPQSVEASRILLQKWKNDKTIKFVPLPRFKPGNEY